MLNFIRLFFFFLKSVHVKQIRLVCRQAHSLYIHSFSCMLYSITHMYFWYIHTDYQYRRTRARILYYVRLYLIYRLRYTWLHWWGLCSYNYHIVAKQVEILHVPKYGNHGTSFILFTLLSTFPSLLQHKWFS